MPVNREESARCREPFGRAVDPHWPDKSATLANAQEMAFRKRRVKAEGNDPDDPLGRMA